MAGPTAQYAVDPEGVAVITLTNSPVNALHPAGKHELQAMAGTKRDPRQQLFGSSLHARLQSFEAYLKVLRRPMRTLA